MSESGAAAGPEKRAGRRIEGMEGLSGPEGESARPTGPQMLLLRLGRDEFALPVGCVREVIETPPVTKVPLAPAAVAGVAAVRGEIVPVVDLGIRLRGRATVGAPRLVTVEGEGVAGRVGLLADDVVGITQVASEDAIEPLPADAAHDLPEGVASGVFTADDERVVVVLRLDRLLAIDESAKEI